ncbi:unnamed protein product, partial [Allacma fusca]
ILEMITLEENQANIQLIKILSAVNLLPLDVTENANAKDVEIKKKKCSNISVKLKTETNIWKWKTIFLLVVIQALYTTIRLLEVVLNRNVAFNAEHFPVHIMWVVCDICFGFLGYTWFIKWPEYTVTVINRVLSSLREGKKPRKDLQLNRQELLAKYVGPNLCIVWFVFILVITHDKTRIHLFFTALPEAYQSDGTFWALTIVEAICLAYISSMSFLVTLCHVIFVDATNSFVKSTERELRRCTVGQQLREQQAVELCSNIRHLQLYMQIFNRSNRFVIFAYKLICITLSVVGGTFAIRFTAASPLVGLICIVSFVDCMGFFGLIYENAFQIPSNTGRAKQQMLVAIQGIKNKGKVSEVTKFIKSVPTNCRTACYAAI